MSKKFFIDNLIDDYLVFLKDIKNLSDNSIKAYKRDIFKFRNKFCAENISKLIIEHPIENLKEKLNSIMKSIGS